MMIDKIKSFFKALEEFNHCAFIAFNPGLMAFDLICNEMKMMEVSPLAHGNNAMITKETIMQKIQVGGHVKFFNEHGKEVDALVTAVWGDPEGTPGINLTFVSLNDEKSDSYGRQIERHSSVVHGDQQSAHGMYWTRSTE